MLLPWQRAAVNPVRRPSLRGRHGAGLGAVFLAAMALAGLTSGCGDDYRTVCPSNGGPCAYVVVSK